jgi:hypothetical protein
MDPKSLLHTRPALALALGAAALCAAPAHASAAGEPTLPLDQVQPGMLCSARSVLHGTTVERFDARVIDVVAGSVTGEGPRILVRVSGPAVDATGVGPGFSGSPISCPGPDGVERIAGAISEGIGDADNRLVLATPIEAILAEPVSTPPHASAARLGRVHRLAGTWALSGAPGWLGQAVQAGAQRAGRTVLTAPAAPLAAFAPVDLQPGSAMAVSLATGDLSLSAIGTVAYRDGDRIWGFGHPLDGAGARSLPLQDAYVYGIVSSPGFAGGSYKLAAPGHTVGTLSQDGRDAVAGTLGAGPPTIPLTVTARDGDRGTSHALHVAVADESRLDDPTGMSPLRLVGAAATAQAAAGALDGGPANETARLCLRIALHGVARPLGFCATSVAEGDMPDALAEQVDSAFGLLDANSFARLRVEHVSIAMTLHRGLGEAWLESAAGPRGVRPGQRITVVATLRRFRGPRTRLRLPVRIPRSARPGRLMVRLHGTATPPDAPAESLADVIKSALTAPDTGDTPPASLPELTARIAALGLDNSITARIGHGPPTRVFRSGALEILGRADVPLRVRAR